MFNYIAINKGDGRGSHITNKLFDMALKNNYKKI